MVNSDKKFFLLCPVPEDQKPINEYLRLKKNSFFNSIPFISQLSEKKTLFPFLAPFLVSFRNGKKLSGLKERRKERTEERTRTKTKKRTNGLLLFTIFFFLFLLVLFVFFFFTKHRLLSFLPDEVLAWSGFFPGSSGSSGSLPSFISWPFVWSFINRLTFTSFFIDFLSFSFSLIAFFYFLIFFRWYQLEKSFERSRFFYEEASWYDGQFWEKPLSLIKNDHLLLNQKIKPILIRNQKLFLQFFVFNFFISILIRN